MGYNERRLLLYLMDASHAGHPLDENQNLQISAELRLIDLRISGIYIWGKLIWYFTANILKLMMNEAEIIKFQSLGTSK